MAPKKIEKEEQQKEITSEDQINEYLKDNEEDHYNFVESKDYVVSSGSLLFDMALGGGIRPSVVRLSGVTEGGKAQPIWSKVLMSNGSWTQIGKLQIGDRIVGKNGKLTKIIGIFPQGKIDYYKVYFSDDTFAHCSLDHLWSVRDCSIRARLMDKSPEIKTLKEIKENLRKNNRNNFSIDFCDSVEYPKQDLPLHPYFVGVILGDGCLSKKASKVKFTSMDKEIVDEMHELKPKGIKIKKYKDYDYDFIGHDNNGNSIKSIFKSLGLYGKLSNNKFIPINYLKSSIEDRINLLKGLMDTDGFVEKKGKGCRAQYTTISKQLKDDVIDLVRGLGGACLLSNKIPTYTYKNKKLNGQKAYTLTISFTNDINPFKLTRKADIFKNKTYKKYKYITKIKKIGKEECVCIKVDSDDSLYLTDDYIVTHNTSSILSFGANFQKSFDKCKVVYIKSEGRLSKEVLQRAGLDLSPEKWFEFRCNVYETAIGLIRMLVKNNPLDTRYFFIIDSMDALIPKGDVERGADEANKVSGGALLTSDFLRRMALALSAHGHICALISQVRSTITINKYQKVDPKVTNAAGGNAALHYSDWIMEFQPRNNDDIIWEGEDGKSNRLGHYCKIVFRKTINESTGKVVRYPIRYKRTNGTSIWVEYEIADAILGFGLASLKGAWYEISPDLIKELKENKIEIEPKIQGINKLRKYLEDNQDLTKYLFKKFRNMILESKDAIA